MTKCNTSNSSKAAYVDRLFTQIARRYDLMNRLMTAGQDMHWRRHVIRLADLKAGSRLLDIGTGTGDLTRLALQQQPGVQAAAVDYNLAMMYAGTEKGILLPFVSADALHLPFAEGTMDVVVSGFLLRNVPDIHLAVREQYRVLNESGRMIVLDTTRPQKNLLWPFIRLYMHGIIPSLGRLLTGAVDAYRYLTNSTEQFLTAEQLAQVITDEGFNEVHFQRHMFGIIVIHQGRK